MAGPALRAGPSAPQPQADARHEQTLPGRKRETMEAVFTRPRDASGATAVWAGAAPASREGGRHDPGRQRSGDPMSRLGVRPGLGPDQNRCE